MAAATTLAMMGLLDIVGTLGSGWLSDRYDKRVLLAGYYGVRGLSLLFLPYADNLTKLALFGILYGLDWIATVPPTVGLASDIFGSAPARSSLAGSSLAIRWVRPSPPMAAAPPRLVWHLPGRVYHRRALALGAAVIVLTIRQGREPVPTVSPHQATPADTPVAASAA